MPPLSPNWPGAILNEQFSISNLQCLLCLQRPRLAKSNQCKLLIDHWAMKTEGCIRRTFRSAGANCGRVGKVLDAWPDPEPGAYWRPAPKGIPPGPRVSSVGNQKRLVF